MAAEQTEATSQTCPACGSSIDTTNAEPLYASATNQPDAARQLAEAAAQSKPEYRDQIALLGL